MNAGLESDWRVPLMLCYTSIGFSVFFAATEKGTGRTTSLVSGAPPILSADTCRLPTAPAPTPSTNAGSAHTRWGRVVSHRVIAQCRTAATTESAARKSAQQIFEFFLSLGRPPPSLWIASGTDTARADTARAHQRVFAACGWLGSCMRAAWRPPLKAFCIFVGASNSHSPVVCDELSRDHAQ